MGIFMRRLNAGAMVAVVGLALASGETPAAAATDALDGTRALVAHTRDGQRIVLGSVVFTPRGDGSSDFRIAMDAARFTDHFLSMREFKCFGGQDELVCHVPYPYPQPGVVRPDDLAWLEHSLLFLYKLPREFGARLWNGLYFRLQRTPAGLVGRPQAIDLNLISAPPDKPGVPPYRPALRDDIAPGARWIESIAIE